MSTTDRNARPLPRFERPSEGVVYWILASLCAGAGGLFQVSLRRLARHCQLSVSTTNRAVLSLARRGIISYRRGQNQVRLSTFKVPAGGGNGTGGRVKPPTPASEMSRPATAVPKVGVPLPNDSDPDLCRDIYLYDHDGEAVHTQDAHTGPDRAKKLALTIAACLDDTGNLALYTSYCRRYPAQVIMRALQGAREPAAENIRVSRGALFNYLVQIYGGKHKTNPDPGHQAR